MLMGHRSRVDNRFLRAAPGMWAGRSPLAALRKGDRPDRQRRTRHRRTFARWLPVLLLSAGAIGCEPASPPEAAPRKEAGAHPEHRSPERLHDLRLTDLKGEAVHPFRAGNRAKASVFLFVATDCPIANRLVPEMRRLHERFGSKEIRFWLVYADSDESMRAQREHRTQYALEFPGLRDAHRDLVEWTGVGVTPEAAVVGAEGELLYRGRINNRFVDFGKERSEATRHDLQEALKAILQDRAVPNRRTQAVGCYIPHTDETD